MSDHDESPSPQEFFPIVRAKAGELAVCPRLHPVAAGEGPAVVVHVRPRGDRRRDFRHRHRLRGMDELRRQQDSPPAADDGPIVLDILL
jgi:hypothetical protein